MANMLHMDTDSVREFSHWMTQMIEEMKTQVDQTAASVQSMSWASPAQEQFLAEYEQARANLQQVIQEGESLNQRVSNEVNEWENMGQNGASRFGGIIDASISSAFFKGMGGAAVTAVAGPVLGFAGYQAGKLWNEYFTFSGIKENQSMSEQDSYLLRQFADNLKQSSSSRKFIAELKSNGLKFTLPDNSFLGDPNGREIPVSIAKTDERMKGKKIDGLSTGDLDGNEIANDPGIIISEEWLREKGTINNKEASATLAHEMQHQLDDHLKRTVYCDETKMPGMSENELEAYIASSIQTRYETEIRAWKLGHEVNFFQAGDVPVEGYTSYYQEEISKYLGVAGKYHVEVTLGENNTTRVNLTPLELVNE